MFLFVFVENTGMEYPGDNPGDPLEDDDSFEEMDDLTFQGFVKSLVTEAIDYQDNELSAVRSDLADRYHGRFYGDEVDGRSQVRDRSIQTAVGQVMPALMRTFLGSEKLLEFQPSDPGDIELADQASDVVNYIFREECEGYRVLSDVFKDALVKRMGVIKYYWDDVPDIRVESFTALSEQQVQILLAEDDVEAIKVQAYPDPDAPQEGSPLPDGTTQPPPNLHDVSIRRDKQNAKITVEAVPPEEFLYSRDARSIEDADFIGQRSYKTVNELVAMGYDQELMEGYAGTDDKFSTNTEYLARFPNSTGRRNNNIEPGSRLVQYIEGFCRIDRNGDGHSELLRVCMAGNAHEVVHDEPVSEIPFATFVPDPEPHSIEGLGIGDLVQDLQRIRTVILRNTLDSLAMSLHPRLLVTESAIPEMDDVLNSEVGSIIRQRQPGSVQPLTVPFVGNSVLPLWDFLRTEEERRTGITQASQGLDASHLQSTTAQGIDLMSRASMARIELITRTFSERGLKRVFKGIYDLLRRHQEKARIVRLRNTWVPIDPRSWSADMDIRVTAPLSSASDGERMAYLSAIIQKQEQYIKELGPKNPMTDMSKLHNALVKSAEIAGYQDSGMFFNDPKNFQPPPPPPPKKTPEEVFHEAQVMQIQADVAMKKAELDLKRQTMLMDDDRKRDELEADLKLKARELEEKYKTEIDEKGIQEAMNTPRQPV